MKIQSFILAEGRQYFRDNLFNDTQFEHVLNGSQSCMLQIVKSLQGK